MSLSWFVIGVLSDDHYLYLIERTQIKGIEYETSWRIAGASSIFLTHRLGELLEIRFLKLTLQVFLPCGFYLDIHVLLQQFLDFLLNVLDSLRATYDVVAAINQEELWDILYVIKGQN